jgi:hypothetical protein
MLKISKMLIVLTSLLLTLAASAQAGDRLPQAKLDGNYFSADGHRFIVNGAHWVPAKTAMEWPLAWNPKDVEADFAKMHELGFNTVRFDLMWAWFEPKPGRYNPKAFAQLDYLVSLANKYRIYLHPSLFIGGEVGEAWWDVPWRKGRDPQTDPEMLRLEANHAAAFAKRYAHETAIIAWDLTDEPPFWISTGTTDAQAAKWTRLIADAIRKNDKMHPVVVGVSTQDMSHGPFRPDVIAKDVDFFSVHPYTIYTPDLFPDPMVSVRGTYGAAFETALSGGAGKPVMVQEMGASSAQYSPQKIVEFDRTSLYSALGAGANGFLLWCFTDAAPEQYGMLPYLRSAHETQFGLTTWDGKVRPQGAAFEDFEKVTARMDLQGLSPAPADAAILIPEEWSRTAGDFSRMKLKNAFPYVSVSEGGAVKGQSPSAYQGNQWVMSSVLSTFILAHEAGLTAAMPRELGDWNKHPIVFLPSPLTATDPIFVHLHTDFWAKAADYVKAGGVLYASLSADAAIPNMTELFGARMTDSIAPGDVTIRIVKAFGELKPGDTFHFTLPGNDFKYWGTGLEVGGTGEIVAVDQDGRPALVASTLGKGRTLLSAYPIEAWLGNTPAAFDKDQPVYRIYRALWQASGARPMVSTDQPSVEAGVLAGSDRGYFVLTNHSGQSRNVTISTSLPVRGLRRVSADGESDLAPGAPIELGPYSGAVLEWRK